MDKTTYQQFRDLIYARSGIALGTGKGALVSARIAQRMRSLAIDDHRMYLHHVLQSGREGEIIHLLDAISTNVTSFFREPEHFRFLAAVFSDWIARGQRKFRLWSAACSTGQEPLSIAITLREAGGGVAQDTRILATDISTKVLDQCRLGIYEEKTLEAVPEILREQYLSRRHTKPETYEVKPAIKKIITFKRLNLSSPPFSMQGPLDAVFCRNVMIYFDSSVRQRLLSEIYRLLKPGGYLMVGHAESLAGIATDFKNVRPSVYVKK